MRKVHSAVTNTRASSRKFEFLKEIDCSGVIWTRQEECKSRHFVNLKLEKNESQGMTRIFHRRHSGRFRRLEVEFTEILQVIKISGQKLQRFQVEWIYPGRSFSEGFLRKKFQQKKRWKKWEKQLFGDRFSLLSLLFRRFPLLSLKIVFKTSPLYRFGSPWCVGCICVIKFHWKLSFSFNDVQGSLRLCEIKTILNSFHSRLKLTLKPSRLNISCKFFVAETKTSKKHGKMWQRQTFPVPKSLLWKSFVPPFVRLRMTTVKVCRHEPHRNHDFMEWSLGVNEVVANFRWGSR